MEGGASVVIPDGEGDLGVLEEEANDVDVTTTAGHVDQTLAELVATAEILSGLEKRTQGYNIAIANGRDFLGVVSGDLFLGRFGKEVRVVGVFRDRRLFFNL